MANLKLDELIVRSAWACGNATQPMTENEKNIVRSIRKFFKMDNDRFNNSYNTFTTLGGHLSQLNDKDPITKIVALYSAFNVALAEKEEYDKYSSSVSGSEREYTDKINESIKHISKHDDIGLFANKLVREISAPEFLNDEDLLDVIEMEKEAGEIYERSVQPLLKAFFNSLEKNNLYDTWEENYLALIKYKSELQDMFGKMDLKEFDTRYKELKSIISNLNKEKIVKEKQIAKELADKEKQIAKEKAEKEKQLAKEKAEFEKNKTHDYSVSNGIHYCRYCGGGEKWREHDCQRELGHKYTLRKVQNKFGFDYSFQPVCNNCGDIRHYCQMDWEYKFKCK